MPPRQVTTLIVLGSGVACSVHLELPLSAPLFATLLQPATNLLLVVSLSTTFAALAKQVATLRRCSRSLRT